MVHMHVCNKTRFYFCICTYMCMQAPQERILGRRMVQKGDKVKNEADKYYYIPLLDSLQQFGRMELVKVSKNILSTKMNQMHYRYNYIMMMWRWSTHWVEILKSTSLVSNNTLIYVQHYSYMIITCQLYASMTTYFTHWCLHFQYRFILLHPRQFATQVQITTEGHTTTHGC